MTVEMNADDPTIRIHLRADALMTSLNDTLNKVRRSLTTERQSTSTTAFTVAINTIYDFYAGWQRLPNHRAGISAAHERSSRHAETSPRRTRRSARSESRDRPVSGSPVAVSIPEQTGTRMSTRSGVGDGGTYRKRGGPGGVL